MSVSPQTIEGGAPADGVITKAATGAKYALFLLFAINLLNFFDRQLLGALAEPIRHEFHLSDTALGLLGTIFTVIYAVRRPALGHAQRQVVSQPPHRSGHLILESVDCGDRLRAELRPNIHLPARGWRRRGHLRPRRPIADRRFVSAQLSAPRPWACSCSGCPRAFSWPTSAPAPSPPNSAGARRSCLPACPG